MFLAVALAALAAPLAEDRAPGAGAHPQPEPVHTRAATVIGLKGPLALGHVSHSLLRLTATRQPA